MVELREAIDALDAAIVGLLAKRAHYIDRAAVLKQQEGLPANIPARVEDVVAKVRARAAAEGLDPELAELIWRRVITWSIAREEAAMAVRAPN
ncbi:MAG: chorismate mutase [Rhizobiaceae bacterium]|jgi:isochorismate pyruvate lyase|nr:chorismate mutase [Rhizobiaceae bacterium]